MHKAVFAVLIGFFLISVILVLTEKQVDDEVEILAIKECRSLLITSAREGLEIVLFFSQDKTFLTNAANISSFKLTGGDQVIALEVEEISAGEKVTYKEKQYRPYQFQLAFSQVIINNATIAFHDAACVITYLNGAVIEIEIGELSLCFMELTSANYLDFYRLSGETVRVGRKEKLSAILIGFELNTIGQIQITGIETHTNMMRFDLMNVTEIAGIESVDLPQVDGDTIILTKSGMYRLPIVYQTGALSLYRFPLIVSYAYLGQDYMLVIDDFLYFRTLYFAEVLDEDVFSYIYHY